MLAIDTNLVVRAIVSDDERQARQARELIRSNDVFLPLTVVVETEWVLRSLYRFDADRVHRAISGFIRLPGVTAQAAASVVRALDWMQSGLDFADALHLAQSSDCDAFVTFDKAFVKAAGKIEGPLVRHPFAI